MASYANDGHANSVESAKATWGDVEQPSTEHVGTTSLRAPEVKKFVPSGCYEVT